MDPKRDMDERVSLEMDPESALRALLHTQDDPPSDGAWDPDDREEASD